MSAILKLYYFPEFRNSKISAVLHLVVLNVFLSLTPQPSPFFILNWFFWFCLSFSRIFLRLREFRFETKINAVGSIIQKNFECDVKSCYKNLKFITFRFLNFGKKFQNNEKKLKRSFGFYEINEFIRSIKRIDSFIG